MDLVDCFPPLQDRSLAPVFVLYEDNHLLAIDKPHGLLTQPNASRADSVEGICKEAIRQRDHKSGQVFLHAIHRLDKPVGGIVLLAKSAKALSRMNEQVRQHRIIKRYTAWVPGGVVASSGILQHFLVHEEHHALVVESHHPQAKLAELSYRIVHSIQGFDQLEITLITGRYHQIRAQFSAVGAPIFGDQRYGSPYRYPQGIALRHTYMECIHPTLRTSLAFASSRTFRLSLDK